MESTLDRADRLDEVSPEEMSGDDLVWALQYYTPYYRDSGFSGHNRMAELADEVIRRYEDARKQA